MGIQISLPMMAFLVFMTGFAGFIDSAAGGGGLISLPAYLFAGLPPHYTYATNKFSAACGTTFATASFFKNGAMNIKVGILADAAIILLTAAASRGSDVLKAFWRMISGPLSAGIQINILIASTVFPGARSLITGAARSFSATGSSTGRCGSTPSLSR